MGVFGFGGSGPWDQEWEERKTRVWPCEPLAGRHTRFLFECLGPGSCSGCSADDSFSSPSFSGRKLFARLLRGQASGYLASCMT
jgi:hypothetical protein